MLPSQLIALPNDKQLSVTVGYVSVVVPMHNPLVALMVTSAAQVMVGGVTSAVAPTVVEHVAMHPLDVTVTV